MQAQDKIRIMKSFHVPKMETLTSLPLQMSLHFNVYFTPFLIICSVLSFILKYRLLSITYQVILISVFIVYYLVEVIRLYLGYYGNLGEKIPALSGFWITTLILQLPISIFLLSNPEIKPLPLERAIYSLHIIFLVTQIFTGFSVIRRIADYQVEQFKQKVIEDAALSKD